MSQEECKMEYEVGKWLEDMEARLNALEEKVFPEKEEENKELLDAIKKAK